MAYPRYQAARAFKFFTRTAGNLTLNSTSWADLPTIGTTWDAVLAAQAGDTIWVGLSLAWGSEAVFSFLDVYTVVGGVVTNPLSGASTGASSEGVSAWRGGTGNTTQVAGPGPMYTLLAGDLSAGTATLRLRYRTNTASTKSIIATTSAPLQFWVRNLGPVDPN